MTNFEFEAEFSTIRAAYLKAQSNVDAYRKANYISNGRSIWHDFVTANMYKLSNEALHYIVKNDYGEFFGEWMVRKAIDLTVFEDIVLLGENE